MERLFEYLRTKSLTTVTNKYFVILNVEYSYNKRND